MAVALLKPELKSRKNPAERGGVEDSAQQVPGGRLRGRSRMAARAGLEGERVERREHRRDRDRHRELAEELAGDSH